MLWLYNTYINISLNQYFSLMYFILLYSLNARKLGIGSEFFFFGFAHLRQVDRLMPECWATPPLLRRQFDDSFSVKRLKLMQPATPARLLFVVAGGWQIKIINWKWTTTLHHHITSYMDI